MFAGLGLHLAAAACPAGWKPSPTSTDAASAPRCFLVPPERSTSLRGCVDRCARHGGAPACLGSQEETGFVTAEVAAPLPCPCLEATTSPITLAALTT